MTSDQFAAIRARYEDEITRPMREPKPEDDPTGLAWEYWDYYRDADLDRAALLAEVDRQAAVIAAQDKALEEWDTMTTFEKLLDSGHGPTDNTTHFPSRGDV